MESTFIVCGMTAPGSFTLYEENDHYWAKNGLPEGYYESLLKTAKDTDGFWKQEIKATVEYEGNGVHNSPINGIVKEIFINGKLYEPHQFSKQSMQSE